MCPYIEGIDEILLIFLLLNINGSLVNGTCKNLAFAVVRMDLKTLRGYICKILQGM